MLNEDKTGLEIFENFVTEPKPKKEGDGGYSASFGISGTSGVAINRAVIRAGAAFDGITIVKPLSVKINKFVSRIKKKLFKKTEDPSGLFAAIKETISSNKLLTDHLESAVQLVIEEAHENGQVALVEKFNEHKERIDKEMALMKGGFAVYIEEKDLVDLVFKEDILSLDWIKNFIRLIPPKVMHELRKARALGVFDNYVVLHYDPDYNGAALTAQEEEARKDPILFGVMSCSRRLYYIGDWVDEYCSLTMDKLVEAIGKKPEDTVLSISSLSND